MSHHARIKRPHLTRTAPNRGWAGIFGSEEPAGNSPAADRIGTGVGLGYRVIEEYIQLGQNAAQAFSAAMPQGWPTPPLGGMPGAGAPFGAAGAGGWASDAGPMFDEFTRNWLQMWQQWLSWYGFPANWAGAEGGNGTGASAAEAPPFEATHQPGAPRSHAGREAATSDLRVRVQLDTSQRTDCAVDLRACSGTPALNELRAPDPDLPRLADCRIDFEAGEWVIRISIPDDQPDAVYSGVIVDEVTALPQGTVWVRIGAAEPHTGAS